MAFHAFSGEDTSCEQAWKQAAPAQLQLPHWLPGGQEDNPQPGLHPKLVLPSGAGGGRQQERACPARDGFWCSPGAGLTSRLFLGLHLTEKMWRSFSPVCDPRIPGLHFQSSLSPVVCHAALPGQPDPQHQALFEQQWVSLCLCQYQSSLLLHFPRVSVTKLLSRNMFLREMPGTHRAAPRELGSDCAAQGALTKAHVGSRISRKKHHP